MPYRRAHYAVLLLFPLVLLAFWPGYFGMLLTAPFALHVHGIAATLWLLLVAAQSWTINARRPALHRMVGKAMFLIVPMFAAGSLLAIQAMTGLAIAKTDPFRSLFSERLALEDAMSLAALLTLVAVAIAQRRRIWTHAAAMVATVFLVLPPIIGRLLPMLPGFPHVDGVHPFAIAFEAAQAIAIVGAVVVARYRPRGARPFLFVAAVLFAESVAFETVARTEGWRAIADATQSVPAWLVGISGLVLGSSVMWLAWRRPEAAGRPMAQRVAV